MFAYYHHKPYKSIKLDQILTTYHIEIITNLSYALRNMGNYSKWSITKIRGLREFLMERSNPRVMDKAAAH
jgi:hypothetical protein